MPESDYLVSVPPPGALIPPTQTTPHDNPKVGTTPPAASSLAPPRPLNPQMNSGNGAGVPHPLSPAPAGNGGGGGSGLEPVVQVGEVIVGGLTGGEGNRGEFFFVID